MQDEEVLHTIWKHGLLSARSLRTSPEGLELELLFPGQENMHAGPDFFNARIRLGQIIWAGNVEIHPRASDWNKHGHQQDPAYDNVILHVVHDPDVRVKNSQGRLVPSLVVAYSEDLLTRVKRLKECESWIPCGRDLRQIPEHLLRPWLPQLYAERMEGKTDRLSRLLIKQESNWQQALCTALASGFGLPINSFPFEMLISKIPLSFLREIQKDLSDLEALLFGYSGLLPNARFNEAYIDSLKQRFEVLKKELPARPMPAYLWKFLRIRPAAFPTLRISQFASFLHGNFPLDTHFLRTQTISDLRNSLQVKASAYWNTHYTFGRISPNSVKRLGEQTANQLLINSIAPFLHLMQKENNRDKFTVFSDQIVHTLQAESNQIIKNWSKFGLHPCSALESQALIQLYQNYCLRKRCPECRIGRIVNKAKTHET